VKGIPMTDLLTPRMIARACQAALDEGAVFAYLRRERVLKALQRRWDPAWEVRAPWRVIFNRHVGYSVDVRRASEPIMGNPDQAREVDA